MPLLGGLNMLNERIFNEVMDGYVNHAIDSMQKCLKEDRFTDEQIENVTDCFKDGLRWAKDEMTLEQARVYRRKY